MTPEERNAVLDFLRRHLQIDENGDNVCEVDPLPGWETGYCAGIRTAYRAIKIADAQEKDSAGLDQQHDPAPPASSAPVAEQNAVPAPPPNQPTAEEVADMVIRLCGAKSRCYRGGEIGAGNVCDDAASLLERIGGLKP